MDISRRLICFLLIFVLFAAVASPVHAEEEEPARELVQQMLNFYRHHQAAAKTDIYRLLEQLEVVDICEAAFWRSIFDHWFYALEELPRNNTSLSDDLPQDDSLCIVVLGYRLHRSGAMEPELIGRLELALEAAAQYPNAPIFCTGGGTAADAPGTTEAHQMARWLKDHGVEGSRIVTESGSFHTIQNAQFVFRILARDYPQVCSLVLITSDYHLLRSSTLFHAQSLLTAAETGRDPVTFAAYLGYEAGHEGISEDPLDQTAHVARLCGFEYAYADAPVLSVLTKLTLDCPEILEVREELPLIVTAGYDSGFSWDVTEKCTVSGYDPLGDATQTVRVSYEENGVQLTASLNIARPVPETEPPTVPPTVATEPPATEPSPVAARIEFPPVFLIPVTLILAAVFLLIRRKG